MIAAKEKEIIDTYQVVPRAYSPEQFDEWATQHYRYLRERKPYLTRREAGRRAEIMAEDELAYSGGPRSGNVLVGWNTYETYRWKCEDGTALEIHFKNGLVRKVKHLSRKMLKRLDRKKGVDKLEPHEW